MAMSARTSSSHTELGEERFGGLEVVDDDENVVHPLKRHIPGA
jgi:hypothetical protein